MVARKGSYQVDIELEWCKKCGICYSVCPTSTIKRGALDVPIVEDHSTCIGCMMCENLCPDFAINVKVVEKVGRTDSSAR